jgi:hypothetical protein
MKSSTQTTRAIVCATIASENLSDTGTTSINGVQ